MAVKQRKSNEAPASAAIKGALRAVARAPEAFRNALQASRAAARDAGKPVPQARRTSGRSSDRDPARRTARRPGRILALARGIGLEGVSIGIVAASAALYAIMFHLAPTPPTHADLWAVNRLPSTIILDRNGKELAARGARYGEQARIEDLPTHLIQAFLATEDRRFYEHGGVDLRGIARAFFRNIRTGDIAEGGSTITQQLAKNLFLTPEQSYVRKAREALLAIWLEGRYTKNEILSLYLNRIYMGAGVYGVESAAQVYFGKSAREVNLAEAAMLAGLPQSPSRYSPTSNPFKAQDRALQVLDNLVKTGAISPAAAAEAKANPPVIKGVSDKSELGWFLDYVAERARALAGPDAIDLVVHTTLDMTLQAAAEAAISSTITIDVRAAGATQAAIIAFDNDTGAVRAMVGGRSYVESQFNRATQARRQPGSAFKPFVYATAFENGMKPTTRMVDQPIDIAGWKPLNYSEGFAGPMRLTEAMAQSVNTIAVQVSEAVGRRNVVALARRVGFRSPIPEAEAGIALGAFNVTLEELTAAYLPFARAGRSVEAFAIERIEDGRGATLYAHTPKPAIQVISREVARDVTHLLFQVVSSGTGKRASLGARPAVGKTGTTNDWRDAWFVGYSGQITAGVWVGNDEYLPMQKVTGGGPPAEVWKAFMVRAHQGLAQLPLEGAYPAPAYGDESELLSFYNEIARSLDRVRRDGNERRYRRDTDDRRRRRR